MRGNSAEVQVGQALETIETDVLPSLSALLSSVAERARPKPEADYERRSAELREMSRQIIELTRFLATVTANAQAESGEPRISA